MLTVKDKAWLPVMYDSYLMAKDWQKLKHLNNLIWKMVMRLMCWLNKLVEVIYDENIFINSYSNYLIPG